MRFVDVIRKLLVILALCMLPPFVMAQGTDDDELERQLHAQQQREQARAAAVLRLQRMGESLERDAMQQGPALTTDQVIDALRRLDNLSLKETVSQLYTDLNRWGALEYSLQGHNDTGQIGKVRMKRLLTISNVADDGCSLSGSFSISSGGSQPTTLSFVLNLRSEMAASPEEYEQRENRLWEQQGNLRAGVQEYRIIWENPTLPIYVIDLTDKDGRSYKPNLFFLDENKAEMIRAEFNHAAALCTIRQR